MNTYQLAKRLAHHVIIHHMDTEGFKIKVLPEYEKAALKLAFHLNCADHETTEERKKTYYQKAWKAVIKLETYYDQVELQEINFEEYIIGKYIAKIKRTLEKELSLE
ncbi:MAG: hypothetical protein Q4G18_07165 [Myroides sp.]|nr:hypothetical protein [Myroides sp.]